MIERYSRWVAVFTLLLLAGLAPSSAAARTAPTVLGMWSGAPAHHASMSGFCEGQRLRDYEKPLRAMPEIPRMDKSGELPFGPRSIRLRASWTVFSWRERVGFSLSWIRSLSNATMDWEVRARFAKVARSGVPFLGDVRRKRLVVRRMGAELADKNVSFAVSAQPAFYRVDISIKDRENGAEVNYAEYFRVVKREFDVRLGLKRDVLKPGEVAVLRLENFGTVPVDYGYPYRIERYENGAWVLDPATPENFILPSFGMGMGISSRCERIPLPDDMQPGRYRIVKEVGPWPGPGRDRRIAREFWVAAAA